jgi:flagellar protein FliO/FliZ
MGLSTYIEFALALIFVIGLILALAWAARRFGVGGPLAPNTGKRRRLKINEVATLDARHKLVLVQRDAVEHLLVIGGGDPLLVERNIEGGAGALSVRDDLSAEAGE